jgi:hypothetical protein
LSLANVAAEYLKDVLHPAVACQACQQQIRGEWYWCAHCALDLCAAHEAVDTHDESHVFVLFKSVVKMSTFRCALRRCSACSSY